MTYIKVHVLSIRRLCVIEKGERTVDHDPHPSSFRNVKSCGDDIFGGLEGDAGETGTSVTAIGAVAGETSRSGSRCAPSSRKSTKAHAGGLLPLGVCVPSFGVDDMLNNGAVDDLTDVDYEEVSAAAQRAAKELCHLSHLCSNFREPLTARRVVSRQVCAKHRLR